MTPERRGGASGLLVLALVAGVLASAVAWAVVRSEPVLDDPWAAMPVHPAHTEHAPLMPGPYETGPEVTRACLACHEEAAHQIMETAHYRWESDPVLLPGRDEEVVRGRPGSLHARHEDRVGAAVLGKANVINNFCIGVQSNWASCTACHTGYGWVDGEYGFDDSESVDCLACHDQTGTYAKGAGGYVMPGVDLTAVAGSVGNPTRESCGSCHFRGGGGDAVKHGDLDETLANPRARLDVHMGEHRMVCTDCHRTSGHDIRGRALSVSADGVNQVQCTDCHAPAPHADDRINTHLAAVSCAACHIPRVALREATKTHWDWSAAGQDIPEDTHEYMKKKGRFEYERGLVPEYFWFNGRGDRFVMGDTVASSGPTLLNPPLGDIRDPEAQIWPVKVHRGSQPADAVHRTLMVPQTTGRGGYWDVFDWDQALRLGAEGSGLPYSGQYFFVETEMHWPQSHMVQPASEALQCADCHGVEGRMDWSALGYPGDPAEWGGRVLGSETRGTPADGPERGR